MSKRARRRSLICVVGILVLIVAGTSAIGVASRATAKDVDGVITVSLPECDVAPETRADGTCEFSGSGIQHVGQTGEPSIPCQSITVLLPPNANLTTVEATITEYHWAGIEGEWDIPPVQSVAAGDCSSTSAVLPTGGATVDGKNAGIYEDNALFPLDPIRKVDVQVMRGWKMAQILYAPFAYNPVERHVFQLSGRAIEVTFKRTSSEVSSAGADLTAADKVREATVNYAEVAGEYGGFAASADTGRYVIITTSDIEDTSTSLMDFVASKEARGFTVQVVTEGTWGGGTGNTAANNIRSWLKNNYIALNIKYVLLIGNPNPSTGDVPMKMCYPQNVDPDNSECPTDFYYAELTSNWNGDGDSRYGEFDDDFQGSPPRAAEVAVGRIPYYGNISDLDHILSKIIAYENAPATGASWRENALLPMKPSDNATPGYQLGEEIKDDVLVPNAWAYHRVYDSGYGLSPAPETTPCTVTNVTNAWKGSDFGAVFWWTHGSETTASYVMNLTNAATLDDAHPSFAFQCSCLNGTPEASNNLGYSLLKNGCISTVCASRVSWYELEQTSFAGTATNSGMTFEYAKRLIANEMSAGDALNDLRFDVSPGSEELWMNYLDFNLYGDPAVGLFTSTPDQAAPSAITYYVQNLTTSSARLRANLTSLGEAGSATVSFQWSTTSGSYDHFTAPEVKDATGTFYSDLSSLVPGTTYYYRAKAMGSSTSYGDEKSFTTLTTPPSVSTSSATGIAASSARLNGNLASLGTADSASVSFQWGTSSGVYASETMAEVRISTGTFYSDLSGLEPDTTYYCRAKATGHGTNYGTEKVFTTLTAPPSVATNDATSIATTSAHLNGYLSSTGSASSVSVSFQWGTTSGNYDHETADEAKSSTGAFFFNLTGLTSDTTYYYRAKADGDGDPVYGLEKVFTAMITPPSVTSTDASNVATTSATLNADLLSTGSASSVSVSFQWGTTSGQYDHETTPEVKDSAGTFYFDLSSLTSGTTYYFRARAVGQGDPAYGLEKSFTVFRDTLIAGVNPVTGGVGQSLVVGISGSGFTGATAVIFSPNIVVSSFQVVNDTQISAEIQIACDATLGPSGVSVTTPRRTATLTQGFSIADSPPTQPHNVAPADKAGVTTLAPILSSSAFSHPCPARSHAASQWQVTTVSGDYSSPVFDSAADSANLTSITLPRGVVGEQPRYWWRVRYQDNRGTWSAWSPEVSFTRPDFIRVELSGAAELRVYDLSSRVTGSVDGESRTEIASSDYFSNTVVLLVPGNSYRYQVVAIEDGAYTLTVTSVAGGQDLVFHANAIPSAAGEIHQYTIDWDALSQDEKGVTIQVDSDGDGTFERTALVEAETDGRQPVYTGDGHGIPAWVWIVAVAGLLAIALATLVLSWVIRRNKTRAAVAP